MPKLSPDRNGQKGTMADQNMTDQNIESLLSDMLRWLAREPRSYRETIEAWRTSCPRLQVWEEAFERGFVARGVLASSAGGDGLEAVGVTPAGRSFLDARLAVA
jgi:hypothetical protein